MVVTIKEGATGALGNTNGRGSVRVSVGVLACATRGSGSKVRSSFRQHGRYFEKNGLAPAKSEMTLSGTSEVREGNFARAAGTVRR